MGDNIVVVYGASDDLVEVEGPIREEFNAYDTPVVVEFSNGVRLQVDYHGRWEITTVDVPDGVSVQIAKSTADDDPDDHPRDAPPAYSDVATFPGPIEWVRCHKGGDQ